MEPAVDMFRLRLFVFVITFKMNVLTTDTDLAVVCNFDLYPGTAGLTVPYRVPWKVERCRP